jgi:hypothetical protein
MGMTGERLPPPNRSFAALKADALAMLGPRDDAWRRPLDVGTIAGRVWLRNSDEVSANPARAASEAVQPRSPHRPVRD